MNEFDKLFQKIKNLQQKEKTLLIAIDGRGGSGKSTLAEKLKQNLPNASIVHLDDFAYPKTDRERLLNQVISPLKENRPAKYQRFDWGTKQLAEWHEIEPGGIVIIEGVSTLHDILYKHYDFRIWIECPAEIGFRRGVERDKKVYQVDTTKEWLEEWMPEEKKYIEEQKPQKRADFIINGEDIITKQVNNESIHIVTYDQTWPEKFEKEKELIQTTIGSYITGGIHHVGSTSIPELSAKPIIDIMVGVESLEKAKPCIELLTKIDYQYYPYKPDTMIWFCKPSPEHRTHHLYLIETTNPEFKARLAFRDYLRNHPQERKEYEELKTQLAEKFTNDREAYTQAKTEFVETILKKTL